MSKTFLVAAVLLGLLAAAVALAVYVWRELGEVEMETDGIVALVLGALAAFALGVGLMRLVYLSHRRGHDDEAGGPRRD